MRPPRLSPGLALLTFALAPPAHAQPDAGARPAPDAGALIAFPGQYTPRPTGLKGTSEPKSCHRLTDLAEKVACFEHVAFDFGRTDRYAAANAALAPPRKREKRVVFFGDSITDNWSRAAFGGFFPGKPYVNRGIGGQTSAQMLIRFRADVIALKPRVVVILAGTNDVSANAGPITPEAIQNNLASLADLARANKIKVVLASLLPVCDDKKDGDGKPRLRTKDRPPETLRALNKWIAAFARKRRHVFLDYHKAMVDPRGLLRPELTDDGLHPNGAGYAIMKPLAERAIAAALRR
jgi:lysophospholipase L1-like esterase